MLQIQQLIESNLAELLLAPILFWLCRTTLNNKEELQLIKNSITHINGQMSQIQNQINLFIKTEIDVIKDLVHVAKGED